MSFPFNVYVLAFVAAGLTSAASLPLWRAWCHRTGLMDDPGHRKIHAEAVPLAGGLAVCTGLVVPLVVAALALRFHALDAATVSPLSHGFGRRTAPLLAILGGALGMVLLGWLDDRHELKAGPKLVGQLLIASLVAASGVRITLFVPSLLFSYVVTVAWILTVTIAFNIMDNMNGLCGGLGAIAAAWFALNAACAGQYLVASLALLACGALVGFLPFNFPNARAFLGDTGSHLVGYLMAVLAVLPHFYETGQASRWAVLSPVLILAVVLGDLVWVVLLRWRAGKPVYVGDTNHLSHRLVRRGLTRTQAVLAIWLLAAVCGAVASSVFAP